MSDKDFDLLLKMLGMTSSDNDPQALVAIRKANDLAAKLGGWEAILRGKVKITILADPFASMDIPRQPSPPPAPRPRTPSPPPQPQAASPNPAPRSQTQPPPQPNRYEGTCTTCRQRVHAGDGLAYKSGSRWLTRHPPGQCPSKPPGTRPRSSFTTDDLQV